MLLEDLEESNTDDNLSWDEQYFRGIGKLGKVVSAVSAARMLWATGKSVYEWGQKKRTLTLTIASSDPSYIPILEWVASEAFGARAKDLALVSSQSNSSWDDDDVIPADHQAPQLFKLVHNAKTKQSIVINGHKISVWLAEMSHNQGRGVTTYSSSIVFSMHTKEAQSALIQELNVVNERRRKALNPPKLFTPSAWGGFNIRGELPKRSLDSVILKTGELEELLADMSKFLSSEGKYAELGVPWHRGYLFYGSPGTGKSSLTKTLANHFGLDVYFLPLGDVKGDTSLAKLTEGLQPKSVLLLEDVDVFSAATSREASSGETSLSGLLNVLDGISTPHGLISILTTNNIDKLDPALIRPGRVDFRKEFTALDQEQGERLFKHFYGITAPHGTLFAHRTPAEVVNIFKSNLDNPSGAVQELELLTCV